MHDTDIVAYTYQADTFCTGCIVDMLPTGEGEKFDGWALADGPHGPVLMSTEDNLREIAVAFGIDYDDLGSYDTDEFPKPVFASQIEDDDEKCGHCHEPLIDN